MIVIDTAALVDSLTGPRRSLTRFEQFVAAGERVVMPALVLYEWLLGPRIESDLEIQEALLPAAGTLAFTANEARIAAALYRSVRSPRGRATDLAIAATAIAYDAGLWTLNRRDFEDIPRLTLV